jgi:hypothetical protein
MSMRSSSRQYAAELARRRELLELQAHVQRVTLAATLAEWEQKRSLEWVAQLARLGVKVLKTPRMRWLLVATVLRRLRRKLRR